MTATTVSPRVITGRGAAAEIPGLVTGHQVFAVASAAAVQRTRLTSWLPSDATLFHHFQPNPTADQAISAAAARSAVGADLVLGVGGGSALDIAKAARALPPDPASATRAIAGTGACPRAEVQLVLVPTTAGTGSEVTQFAAFYRGGRKISLDAACVQADIAVIDPDLTDSCPALLTWSCAFDAVAHAVESTWSTRATSQSRAYAMAALALLVPVLRDAGHLPTMAERDALSEAGTLAGWAIDLTRTTAAHALAYPLTAHLGVPHGLACALNLTWLAPMIESGWRCPAANALRDVLGVPEGGLGAGISELLVQRGLQTTLGPVDAAVADVIVDEGLASNRVSGTPIALDRRRVRASIGELLG